ncbi:MAG: hypothetical protein JWO20_1376 [Candidatus Angelobacter sp.]|nr:hypothetical protein [Candidatus Angelobacter sp.]
MAGTPQLGEKVEPPPLRLFTFRQRLALFFISTLGTLAIRLIGPTIRFEVEIEEGGTSEIIHVPAIYCFWHQCVFASAWVFRNRQIAVMTSRSFDGEYIARIIQNLSFRAVRGSSSRDAARALLGMHTEIENGHTVAFTIDGPRGPRHVAKPGPVLLARNTQVPLICYHLALQKKWTLRSWDQTMIPKPFTRALVRFSKVINVTANLDSAGMEKVHAEMQAALERVTAYAESRFSAGQKTE